MDQFAALRAAAYLADVAHEVIAAQSDLGEVRRRLRDAVGEFDKAEAATQPHSGA